ncbi:DUF6507 family protein [Citricoccus nitrophenolicus]|uniref:DUF6507 family protein n=1 Tax=Citricoccus nitrophenolicus TaxID=863575 RepID=UPI0039B3F35E
MTFELDYGDSSAAVTSTAGTAEDLRGDFQAGHQAAGEVADTLTNSPVVAGALTSLRGEVLYSFDSVIGSSTRHNISATGQALEIYREGDEEMFDRAASQEVDAEGTRP